MKPAPEGDLKAWLDKLLPHNPTMVSTLAGLSGVGVLPVRFIPCGPPPRQQTDTGTPNLLAVTQHGKTPAGAGDTAHFALAAGSTLSCIMPSIIADDCKGAHMRPWQWRGVGVKTRVDCLWGMSQCVKSAWCPCLLCRTL